MAGSPGSKARQRRSAGARESRERQWIYLAAGGVLALVAVIVVVGLVVAWYLPPRAHVLTVGERDFNAGEVAERAVYLVSIGNGNAQTQPAEEGMTSLVRQEILLQPGQVLVGKVADQEVQDAIAERLGLPDEYEDAAYAEGLRSFLRVASIDRRSLEEITRAGVVEDRLLERLRDELPEAGDQARLWLVRTNERARAQALIEAVRGGQDFHQAAVETGAVEDESAITDAGWVAPEALGERLRPAFEGLATGDVTDILDDASNVGFEVYYVEERTADQPYDDAVRDQLADEALRDFLADQEEALQVERDLSTDERRWITRRVQDRLLEVFGG